MTDYDVTPPPERLTERVRIRKALSTERGDVTKFMAQLEYCWEGDWREVVRYDHNRDPARGHDITENGLHRDVYRDGEKIQTVDVLPSIPAGKGFNIAEKDLRDNAQPYIGRFQQWHGITTTTDRSAGGPTISPRIKKTIFSDR